MINWGQPVETVSGDLEVHFVGIGICGQPIVQIQTIKGDDNSWILARVEENNGAVGISFGKERKAWALMNVKIWDGEEHN